VPSCSALLLKDKTESILLTPAAPNNSFNQTPRIASPIIFALNRPVADLGIVLIPSAIPLLVDTATKSHVIKVFLITSNPVKEEPQIH
jgi:hypothetical protein